MTRQLFTLCFICVVLLGVSLPAWAQSRYVLKVIGKVADEETGRAIEKGDVILPDTPLKFADLEAKVLVVSQEKGREVLSSYIPNISKEEPDDFTSFVAYSALPPKSNRRLSSKSAESGTEEQEQKEAPSPFVLKKEDTPVDMKNVVLLDKRPMNIDPALPAEYPTILLHYVSDGKDVFKMLPQSEGQIVLDKAQLFPEGTHPYKKNVILHGYKKANEAHSVLAMLTLVMPDTEQLGEEITLIVKHTPKEKIEQEILQHILYNYCCAGCELCVHPEDVHRLYAAMKNERP